MTYLQLFLILKKHNITNLPDQLIYQFFSFFINNNITDATSFVEHKNTIVINPYKYIKIFKKMINKNIPLERMAKKIYFYNHLFFLYKKVFSPRVDTEYLVFYVLEYLKNVKNKKVIELGTGSGAIICTIALNNNKNIYFGYENNLIALLNTKKNIKKYNLKINMFYKNYLNSLKNGYLNSYDIFVINPPYIDINDKQVEQNVLKYDPKSSLFAKNNGYFYYFKLINYFYKQKEKKVMFFEIGIGMDSILEKHLISLKVNYKFYKDINNINRVLYIEFN